MIAGKKYKGLNADLWSSGVVLFAMICGYLPFEDPNTSKLYKKILGGEYSIPKFVSDNCADMIKQVLNTDPETRCKVRQIREHAWFQQRLPVSCNKGLFVGFGAIPVNRKVLSTLLA